MNDADDDGSKSCMVVVKHRGFGFDQLDSRFEPDQLDSALGHPAEVVGDWPVHASSETAEAETRKPNVQNWL